MNSLASGEQQAGEQDDIYTSWDPIDRHYRRLLLRDGRLRGVLLMGDCTAAAALTARLESDEPATADWLFDPSSTQPQAAGIMTMTKPVLVLVGHGMVGHHFLEQCVSRNLHQQYRIVVFGEERYAAYDRVHLRIFRRAQRQSLSLVADDFFHQHGIELRLGEAVATIDRDARLVRDAEGHETHWDKLVLATGSYPLVPPIPGNDLDGCFVYRTLDDLDRIAAHAAAAKTGVVIGGGLLGLEAANALKQLGLDTHVVEFAPNLMAVQLDNGGAAMLRRRSSPSAWGAYQQSDHRHRARGRRPAAELCRRRRAADRHGGLLGGDPSAGRAGPRLHAAGGRTRGHSHRRPVPHL